MEQEQFLHREELVQAHQLGELYEDYTIRVGKMLVRGEMMVLLATIILFLCTYYAVHKDMTETLIASTAAAVFGSAYIAGALYYNRGLHVYLYTAGLIFWRRKKWRVIRWEQIRKVSSFRGDVTLEVNNEPKLVLSALIEWQNVLVLRIKNRVASQEADQQPALQPTTSSSEPSAPVHL